VVELRVELKPGADVSRFSALPAELADRYPTKDEHRVTAGEFQMIVGTPVQAAQVDLGVQGYRYTSSDRTAVAQLRMNGFTFSRLAPYTDWDSVITEARAFWNVYLEANPVAVVARIATRYINSFRVPIGRSVNEYLTIPPRVPEGVAGTALRGSLSRLAMTHEATGFRMVLMQAVDPDDDGGAVVVLDTDVYSLDHRDPMAVETWLALEQLRDVKNRIFFGSITEVAAKEFE
jgi:uncharacterized protein (TIGR04255 family)